jgi:hypothetical protein
MNFAPQHNWTAYRELTRASNNELARGLTLEERYSIYCELFNTFWRARMEQTALSSQELERLDQWHRRQKLAERDRLVRAFQKRDSLIDERNTASHIV